METNETPTALFRLGELNVFAPLGEGGMAEVWSARDGATGTLLAVKVLKFGRSRPELASSLAREVRAMARLPHENIVGVLGQGTVSEMEAARAPKRLVPDAPWFAMEQFEGSLRDQLPRDWASIRLACAQILRGLAHAHARGVIHRDLKPSNVLLSGRDESTRIAIADFGIAHVRDERDARSAQLRRVMGTPLYMAPEQYAGRWRDFGPWTDLYALGCMVFEFVYGRPPFVAPTIVGLAQEHTTSPVPHLVPRVDVPSDVADWLICLMAKDPSDRPSCAADALAALPDGSGGLHFEPSPAADWGVASTLALLDPLEFAATSVYADQGLEWVTEAEVVPRIGAAPIAVEPPRPSDHGCATGPLATSLFELRPLPEVARWEDRIRLWGDLHRVIADGAFARILSGPRSAVGDLVMEQFALSTVEAGAATWLQCAARVGGDRVLLNGLSELLGVVGLSPAETSAHLSAAPLSASWRPDLRSRLADVLGIASSAAQPRMGTHAARERHATVRETLRALASERPLLVTLTDAHADDLEVIEGLLEEETPEPLLFVGWLSDTTRDRMQGWAMEAFAKLAASPRSEVLQLHALTPKECVQWVARNLDLSPQAVQSAERAELDPSATVQLFGHWIRTGMVRWSPAGYELVERARLPSNATELWCWRLQELNPHREALEVAAALGRVVSLMDWNEVCAAAGIQDAAAARDATASRGMGTLTNKKFTFASDELRRLVLEQAPPARLRTVHGLIADTLELSLDHHLHHLLQSERYEQLLETLGGVWTPQFLTNVTASPAVQIGLQAAKRLGLDDGDLRVARVNRNYSRQLRAAGKLDEAIRVNDQVLAVARREGDWRLEADSLVRGGVYLQIQGEFADASARLHGALAVLKPHAIEEPRLMGLAMVALGMLEGDTGDLTEAIGHMRAACKMLARAEGDALVSAQTGLGSLLVRAGRFEDAHVALARAIEVCETMGSRMMLGRALNMMGDLEQSTGNLEEARLHYQRARRALAFVGGDDVAYPMFNLAMLAFNRGARAEATALFADVKEIADRNGAARLRAFASAGLGAAEAGRGGMRQVCDWDEVAGFVEAGIVGVELSQLLESAGRTLAEAGAAQAALRVRELAVVSWGKLGREREAEALTKEMHEADDS